MTGGASWVPVNSGLANGVITALAINPVSADTLYAGTNGGGVWKSVNGGNSWTPASNGLPAGGVVSALAINPPGIWGGVLDEGAVDEFYGTIPTYQFDLDAAMAARRGG